jgi:hypothetical protein
MKHVLLILGIGLVLASCASLPEPEGEGTSLVIGHLVLDFPDGFFDKPARAIQNGIKLNFLNATRQTKFSLQTLSGYFYFLANGTDSYVLESYEYEFERVTLGRSEVKWKIAVTPDKVNYLGHLTIFYLTPKLTLEAGTHWWSYTHDSSMKWDKDAVRLFISKSKPDSRWLGYEVVEARQAK